MSSNIIRTLGHPGLRQPCLNVNISKIGHKTIKSVCKQLLECMTIYGTQSISAPQIGHRYNMFAMDTIFYKDFEEEKSDFESIFMNDAQNEEEMQGQMEEMQAYLSQLEYHLNANVPYESDIAILEKLMNDQQQNSNRTSSMIANEHKSEMMQKRVICINPQWSPLELDEGIFETEQSKGNMNLPSNLSSMYSTLLFGCGGQRTSNNYEQCVSIPGFLCLKKRYNRIRAGFVDEYGQSKICYLKSSDARLFQHECEHLHGMLMVDYHEQQTLDIICVQEFVRRQQISKPKLEKLMMELSADDHQELYKYYDPLHPPIDEDLIEILENILKNKKEFAQEMKQKVFENEITIGLE